MTSATRSNRKTMLVAALVALLASTQAFAADGDKSTIKGWIIAINGNDVTVRDDAKVDHHIVVTPQTTYKQKKGLTGVVYEKSQQGALLPGLTITADLVATGKEQHATGISFTSEDLKTARQVRAGTGKEMEGIHNRMNDFGTYEALQTVDVLFDTGSSKLSAKAQTDLQGLAKKAKETKGYQVVMQGFTDSTGDAKKNERLSIARAHAVAQYLQTKGGLMPGRVREPDGMGVAAHAGTGSNANARKVTVKLVVDKGVNAGAK
ncbi:OmpA family protein [Cognatilysobacter terrigena]|uniref:OmpA family protein n=1 Tax=Cognatilysobacter terrigena TaxID=2488749 RepID=UPI001414DE76|nr:OmpA family protein [Lysobacter terrigena]